MSFVFDKHDKICEMLGFHEVFRLAVVRINHFLSLLFLSHETVNQTQVPRG